MFYPELAELPPILDFEASSFSDESYPISAGLIVSGKLYYWLIKPKQDWIDWALPSQAIHGIKRSVLIEQGLQADQVFDELMTALNGHECVYSDAPLWERLWMSRLGQTDKIIMEVKELIPNCTVDLFKLTLSKNFENHKLIRHKANHDALAISITVRDLRLGAEI